MKQIILSFAKKVQLSHVFERRVYWKQFACCCFFCSVMGWGLLLYQDGVTKIVGGENNNSTSTCSQKLVKIWHLCLGRCHLCHTCYHPLRDLTHGQVWLWSSLTSQLGTLQQEVVNRTLHRIFLNTVGSRERIKRHTQYALSLFFWSVLVNQYSRGEGNHLSQKGSG